MTIAVRTDDKRRRSDHRGAHHPAFSIAASVDASLLGPLDIRAAVPPSPDEIDFPVIRLAALTPDIAKSIFRNAAQLCGVSDGEDVHALLVGIDLLQPRER